MENQDTQGFKLTISGMTEAEVRDLSQNLPDGLVAREQKGRSGQEFHALDPISAVVIITVATLIPVALRIAQDSKREEQRYKYKVTQPDGTQIEEEFTFSKSEVKNKASVVKAIVEKLGQIAGLAVPGNLLANAGIESLEGESSELSGAAMETETGQSA